MTLSQAGLQAALSQRTEEVFLECLTIEHPDLSQAIRLVNDKVDLFRAEGAFWGFNGSVDGWTAHNAVFETAPTYVTVHGDAGAPTPTDPYIRSPASLSIDGSTHSIIRARLRRVSGVGWDGRTVYTTGSHTFDFTYHKDIDDPTQAAFAITNHDFEDGDTGWDDPDSAWSIAEHGVAHTGTWSAAHGVTDGTEDRLFTEYKAVTAGASYIFGGWTRLTSTYLGDGAIIGLFWYDSSQTFLSANFSTINAAADDSWYADRTEVVAPDGAAYARACFIARRNQTAGIVYADNIFITPADSWVIAEWDMSDLTAGGTDWTTSTVNQILTNLGTALDDLFDIDWIAIGTKYIAFPFSARLHARSEERIPEAEIVADNVDQRIVQNLRGLSDGATVRYEAVLAGGEPNAVEQGPFNFEIHGFVADAATVQLRIGFAMGFLNEAWPKDWFAPWNSG